MLTFFRRIRKELLDTSQTRKYILYAIGEIALVVIGILIALQINNWNEGRKERVKEKEILRDLIESMEGNINQFENTISQIDGFARSSEIIIHAVETNQPYSDSLLQHFPSAITRGSMLTNIIYAGYESLKNQGFDILRSETLKDQIVNLHEVTYKATERLISYYNEFNPNDHMFNMMHFLDGIPIDYESLIKEQYYHAILLRARRYRNLLHKNLSDCLLQSRRILQLLKDELGE